MARQMKGFLAAIVLALLSLTSSAVEVKGTVVSPEHVKVLAAEAARLSRYPLPDVLPSVVVLNEIEYAKVARRASLAFFQPVQPDFIFLNGGMPEDMADTVLVHELVHYMQWKAGVLSARDPGCAVLEWIEQEAFVVSYRFEVERGGVNHGLVAVNMQCPR